MLDFALKMEASAGYGTDDEFCTGAGFIKQKYVSLPESRF